MDSGAGNGDNSTCATDGCSTAQEVLCDPGGVQVPDNASLDVEQLVTITWDEVGGWSDPAACEWKCNPGFGEHASRPGECHQELSVACVPGGAPAPASPCVVDDSVSIRFDDESGWPAAPACGWLCVFPVARAATVWNGEVNGVSNFELLDEVLLFAGPFEDHLDFFVCGTDRSFLLFDTASLGEGAQASTATLYLDFQESDYLLDEPAITELRRSTWDSPASETTFDSVGELIAAAVVWSADREDLIVFDIPVEKIENTQATRFALKNEHENSCWRTDPGYRMATSYLEVRFTP